MKTQLQFVPNEFIRGGGVNNPLQHGIAFALGLLLAVQSAVHPLAVVGLPPACFAALGSVRRLAWTRIAVNVPFAILRACPGV